jgi:hypothetical protein
MSNLKETGYILFAIMGGVFLAILGFVDANQEVLYIVGTFYIVGLMVLFAAIYEPHDNPKG